MFLYTHIEKCAGTSIHKFLEYTFFRYLHVNINQFGGNDPRNDLSQQQFTRFLRYFPCGLGGHSLRPYINFIEFPIRKLIKFTFLRNPMDRYMSHLNHALEMSWCSSIDDFLTSPYYNNFMTVKIAGKDDPSKAEEILRNFDFIGDVNQFGRSINALQDVLRVRFYGISVNLNSRSNLDGYLKFENLTTAQKFLAEKNISSDRQLYENVIIKSDNLRNFSADISLKPPSILRHHICNYLEELKRTHIIKPVRSCP